MKAGHIKFRLLFFATALLLLLSSCSAPATKTFRTGDGDISLDMARRYAENSLGAGRPFEIGDATLIDYGPVVAVYDDQIVQGMCVFEPGIPTASGIEVGMTLEEARAKAPEWAEEETAGGAVIRVDYSPSGKAPGGEAAYTTAYVFSGDIVNHMITAYPNYVDLFLETYAITPPNPAKTLTTPAGDVSLDMRRSAIEAMYTQEYEIAVEGGVMLDYGPLIVIYDEMGNAKSVRAFEAGFVTADGVEVGMAFEDVLARLPERAREITVQEDRAIRVGYSETGEAPDGPAAYTGIYRFRDNLLERVIIGYPGYTSE